MRTTTRRWSGDDSHWGPFTLGRSTKGDSWRPVGVVLDSGDDDEYPGCHLRVSALGYTLLCETPGLIEPWRRWVDTSHYEWGKTGGGYWDAHPREFGFSLSGGFLQVFLGPQTGDSRTTRSWCKHLPWTQWRFHRHAMYGLSGEEHWSRVERRGRRSYDEMREAKEACPSASFEAEDYDGKRVTARTTIEQREWRFGEGWFRWLSLLRADKVQRTLDIAFSDEVGPEKGSWKGGTVGTGIEMLPGELHEAAFRRFCEQDHRSKSGKYRLKYIGTAKEQG